MNSKIQTSSRVFGQLPSGETVHEYTLDNGCGLSMKVLDFGGIVTQLHVPDRQGLTADIVLGFDRLDPYLTRHPYIGSLVGRVAGRITGATFTLDGTTYALAVTDPPNHLHGGTAGFDRRLWKATTKGRDTLVLRYLSRDGEEGYPGNLDVTVTYRLTGANEWILDYAATCDRPTPFCPTHHAYFNLSGEGTGTIENHRLQIFSDRHVPVDDHLTLSGRYEPVAGSPSDVNQLQQLGDVIPGLFKCHGDTYLLRRTPGQEPTPAARLEDPTSGRAMEISTTEQYLQFYTSAFLDGTLVGKAGRPYPPFSGLCLECQGYADGANRPELGNIILQPGQTYRQTTIQRFTAS